MIDKSIDTIIFDYGGVLINLDYQATINAFGELGIDDFESLYSQAEQSNLFNDLETGQISPAYFINQLLELLPANITPNQVVHAWNSIIKDVPKESVELLLKLKRQGYRLFLLSNTNQLHIDVADSEWLKVSEFPLVKFFDAVYYSHEVKMRKPNAEIFEFVCTENVLDPKKTLFIDDSIQHIEGAKKMGLQTVHLEKGMLLQELFS
ncbi:MAG: HAD family phosphatase [Fluviicola sp.]|nr:HAD family phosphatase [Fluviicola sp.]